MRTDSYVMTAPENPQSIRGAIYSVTLVLALLSWSSPLCAWEERQALALVENASNAQVRRSENSSRLEAKNAELLYQDDVLVFADRGGTANVLLCRPSNKGSLYRLEARPSSPFGEATVERDKLVIDDAIEVSVSDVGPCALPKVPVAPLPTPALPRTTTGAVVYPNEIRHTITRAVRSGVNGINDLWRIHESFDRIEWPLRVVQALESRPPSNSAPEIMGTPEFTRHLAFVVGINSFDDFTALEYAAADARTFAKYLDSPRGAEAPNHSYTLLTSMNTRCDALGGALCEPTYSNFTDLWKQYLQPSAVDKNTKITLFIASHGVAYPSFEETLRKDRKWDITRLMSKWTANSPDGYILVSNTDAENPQSTAISVTDLRTRIGQLAARAGAVTVYIDACRANRFKNITKHNLISTLLPSVSPAETYGNIFTLLASSDDQLSYEHDAFGHGAFTYFLLRGLNNRGTIDNPRPNEPDNTGEGNSNAVLGSMELARWVQNRVSETLKIHLQLKQVPDFDESTRIRTIADLDKDGIVISDYDVARFTEKKRNSAGVRGDTLGSATIDIREAISQCGQFPAEAERRCYKFVGERLYLRYLEGHEFPMDQSDYRAGAQAYAAIDKHEPGSPETLARLLFFEGRAILEDAQSERLGVTKSRYLDSTRQKLEASIRYDPTSSVSFNALGAFYLERAETGDLRRAEGAFRDAIKRAPHWSYPRHNIALTYWYLGLYDEALRAFHRAIRNSPTEKAYLHYSLGLLLMHLNRNTEAMTELHEALKISERGLALADEQKRTAQVQGIPLTGLDDLQLAYGARRYEAILSLASLGSGADPSAAIESIKSLIHEIDTHLKSANRRTPRLARLRRVATHDLALLQATVGEPLANIQRVLETNLSGPSPYPPSVVWLARLASCRGEWDTAVELLERAETAEHANRDTKVLLARAYLEAGEPRRAEQALSDSSGNREYRIEEAITMSDIRCVLGQQAAAITLLRDLKAVTQSRGTRRRVNRRLRSLARGECSRNQNNCESGGGQR